MKLLSVRTCQGVYKDKPYFNYYFTYTKDVDKKPFTDNNGAIHCYLSGTSIREVKISQKVFDESGYTLSDFANAKDVQFFYDQFKAVAKVVLVK